MIGANGDLHGSSPLTELCSLLRPALSRAAGPKWTGSKVAVPALKASSYWHDFHEGSRSGGPR
jgi:hypothetical protein